MSMTERREQYRFFLKDTIRKQLDFSQTPQSLGASCPSFQKPVAAERVVIELPDPDGFDVLGGMPLVEAIRNRRSRRRFTDEPLTLHELAFLLWATQGVQRVVRSATFRTVPSAGARHAFETYVFAHHVSELAPAVYRYLPLDHQLVHEFDGDALPDRFNQACLGQSFVGASAVVFAWSTLPYRMEWRYELAAHKVIAIDAGHVCQNLYLACEAIGCGTCAVGAYDQDAMDALLRLDGRDEFTIYIAPVGRLPAAE